MSEMGNRIRTKRLEKGLTMEELGNMLGVKASAINKYEKGTVENIKRSMIKKMAKIFECDPNWLMGFQDYYSKGTPIESFEDNYMKEALELYGKYMSSNKKTRTMVDMLLEDGD